MAMTRISLTGDKHKQFHPAVQDWAGAATYVRLAQTSDLSLFI